MLCLFRFLLDHLIFFIAVTLLPLFVGLAIGGVVGVWGLGHDGLRILGLDRLRIHGEWLDITQGRSTIHSSQGVPCCLFPIGSLPLSVL